MRFCGVVVSPVRLRPWCEKAWTVSECPDTPTIRLPGAEGKSPIFNFQSFSWEPKRHSVRPTHDRRDGAYGIVSDHREESPDSNPSPKSAHGLGP